MAQPPRDAPGSAPRAASVPPRSSTAEDLVATLDTSFRAQVGRALAVELDGSVESLAFVDHYLRMAHDELREPIVSLIAAGAGAYFGALVCRTMGAMWVGDGKDPRRLRLLLTPQLIHFSPVDQAYEAIAGQALSPDDPRIAAGPALDPVFHLRPPSAGSSDPAADGPDSGLNRVENDDASWLQARLAELSPMPEDQFHSLTARFETLQLMLELLAAKHAQEGRSPKTLGLPDYLSAVSGG